MTDENAPPRKKRRKPGKGEEFEVQHLAETTGVSAKQARELLRRHGNDWRKLEEAAKTFKDRS